MIVRSLSCFKPAPRWRRLALGAGLCLLASTLPPTVHAQAQGPCLGIQLREKSDRLVASAGDADAALVATSERSARLISKEFRKLYETLEENGKFDTAFDARLRLLSDELLGPLRPALDQASCVVFQIDPGFLHFALDLLPVDGEPLFVRKPVAFTLAPPASRAMELPAARAQLRGLIVRDPDTDPEDGAGEVHTLYPASQLRRIEDADPRMFAYADYDFLLLSAHGSVTPSWGSAPADLDDSISLGKRDIEADALDGSRFKLVYLDSCQLGISESFITSARRNGARHFLGPIISNESGNSSTLMIRYFFGALRQGGTPMDALFRARRQIYQEFQGKVERSVQVYYAYPFRLYLL